MGRKNAQNAQKKISRETRSQWKKAGLFLRFLCLFVATVF
jgi:hypothetical protein